MQENCEEIIKSLEKRLTELYADRERFIGELERKPFLKGAIARNAETILKLSKELKKYKTLNDVSTSR